MDKLVQVDWAELFIPTHSILEMIVRGTIMFLALFVIMRFLMKRQMGSIGIADILVIVVIADAAQNAFSREYRSVTEGVILVITIVFWDFVVDSIEYHFPRIAGYLEPRPLELIRDGKMLRHNMRQELITVSEMNSKLRQHGIQHLAEVKSARMEPDGEISVIRQDP